MPFDARLIHPDEPSLRPDGELDLPDDLAALAAQLADDARHLAAQYPPGVPRGTLPGGFVQLDEQLRTGRLPMRARIVAAAGLGGALAAIVALGLAISIAWRTTEAPSQTKLAATDPVAPVSAEPRVLREISATSPRPATAALSVGELSGPELEAVLDLLKGQPPAAASISF